MLRLISAETLRISRHWLGWVLVGLLLVILALQVLGIGYCINFFIYFLQNEVGFLSPHPAFKKCFMKGEI